MPHVLLAMLVVTAAGCAAAGASSVRGADPSADAGFFSRAQADRGARTFESACRECHGLADFRGETFEWEWRRRTAWDFFDRMSLTMPEDRPATLSDATYVDLVAYILSLNGYATGRSDLVPTQAALSAIPMGPGARKTP